MGIMSVQQIRNEILSYHANRPDLDTTRLNRLIDLGQYRIARMHNWDDLKMSVLGNLTVSPGDARSDRRNDRIIDLNALVTGGYRFKDIYNFKVVDTVTLVKGIVRGLTAKDFDRQYPDPDWYDRRMPQHYTWYATRKVAGGTVYKNSIELGTAPDIPYEFTLRLQVYPRLVSDGTLGDNDVLDFSEHDDAVINYAVSQIYQSLGREDKAKEHYGFFRAMVEEILSEDNANTDNNIAGVEVGNSTTSQYWNDPFVKSVR